MRGTQSTRCLFCNFAAAWRPHATRTSRQELHTTSVRQARRKPAYPNIRAIDMRLVEEATQARQSIRPYTPREKQLLALKYTPAQIKAIEAGEKSIDPNDILFQGQTRGGPMTMNYIDDMSKIDPIIDKPVRPPDEDTDPDIEEREESEVQDRFTDHMELFRQKADEFEARQMSYKDEDARIEDLRRKADEAGVYPGDGLTPEQRKERMREYFEYAEGPDYDAWFERFMSDENNFFDSPKGTLAYQQDYSAPTLPKYTDKRLVYRKSDDDPRMETLMKQTGMTIEQIRRIRIKVLVQHRVVNQTRMGKIQSIYNLTIAGNEKGMLGIGEGKSAEFEDSRRQAMMNAIRNMKPIPRYEERTIYGDIEGKVGASVVQLSARPPGFGNRCQHLIFEMARAAGLSDLAARCVRSRNKMNVVKATYQALLSQRMPEDIARSRGRKMVDVRKVYYAGAVH